MTRATHLHITPDDIEATAREEKRRAAEVLFEQLTAFAESIATEASGDGEFDLEFNSSIHISRACLLRWIAINSPVTRRSRVA